ncbi:MAG: hypothetical protein ACRENP_11245 [Longimicrobiales bacterium]
MIRSYFFTLLRRSLGFWLGVRLVLALLGAPLGAHLSFSPAASILTGLLVVGLLLFDSRTSGEYLLVANFGLSQVQVALTVGLLVVVLELFVLIFAGILS